MSNREKWTAHAMFPVKDAGLIAAWPLLAFRDLRLLKLESAPPPRHRAVGERRDGEEGDDEEEVEVGETEEEEEYELEDEE